MKKLAFLLLGWCTVHTALGQSEEAQIRQVIYEFIEGTVYNYPDKIINAFYPEAQMFLYTPGDTLWRVSPATYASWYNTDGLVRQTNDIIKSPT